MILLATFVSVSLASPRTQVPSIEVEQVKVPYQTEGSSALGKYSPDLTKRLCERMGDSWKMSLIATLPEGTTVTMTCVKDNLREYAGEEQ